MMCCHEKKQWPKLRIGLEVKSQRCNFFIPCFVCLYLAIQGTEQNRKSFSVSPTKEYAPDSAGNLCFVQGSYWPLFSSSPRDVTTPMEWWSHEYKQNVTQTCFRICLYYYLFFFSLLHLISFSAHHQTCQFCSLATYQFYSRQHRIGSSLLASIVRSSIPASIPAVKGWGGNAWFCPQLFCCELQLIP